MRSSRENRVRLLLALTALAAAGLVVADQYHTSPAATVAGTQVTQPSGSAGTAATKASIPPGSTTASTSSVPASTSTSSTSTTTVLQPASYPVASVQLSIEAHNLSGTTVPIPTTVFYPDTAGSAPRRFPLVIFSPGYNIDPTVYTPLISAWVAAGFVVPVVSYPDTLPGSALVETDMVNHPSELSQVITDFVGGSPYVPASLSGIVDGSLVAVAGQSDGGDVSVAAAAGSCCKDTRIKAAIILSGAEQTLYGNGYFATGSPPMLVVQGGQDPINAPSCSEQIYDGAPQPRFYLAIPAASHLSAYTAPVGPQLLVTRAVTVAFLEKYLSGAAIGSAGLSQLASSQGSVAYMVSGTATVPIVGNCLGAPPGP